MSKIHALKQQKRYKNETMSILTHMNTKSGTAALPEKSFAFKNVHKQEVQSSRLSARVDQSMHARKVSNSKQKYTNALEVDKQLKILKREGMSSKSIETHLKGNEENDRTKKNSYAKLQTEVPARSNYGSVLEKNIEKRLKQIQKIFHPSPHLQASSKKIKSKKQISNLRVDSNYQTTRNLSSKQYLSKIANSFSQFYGTMEERRMKMIYDEADQTLQNIFKALNESMSGLVLAMLEERQSKLIDIEMNIQELSKSHARQMQAKSNQMRRMKMAYTEKIEEMLQKSLYTTDKINWLQRNGVVNFEYYSRIMDDGERPIGKNEAAEFQGLGLENELAASTSRSQLEFQQILEIQSKESSNIDQINIREQWMLIRESLPQQLHCNR